MERVSFVSSTALGTVRLLRNSTRQYIVICGVATVFRKGLASVGVIAEKGKVLIYDNIESFRKQIKLPTGVAKMLDDYNSSVIEVEKEGIQEAEIIKSYYPKLSRNEIVAKLHENYSNVIDAYHSNFLILPAKYESTVPVFTFIRRLAKETGNFTSADDDHLLSDHECEIISKEVVENICRWAYRSAPCKGFIARASIRNKQMLVGFADWGQGPERNYFRQMMNLGGHGEKRIEHLIRGLHSDAPPEKVLLRKSPAPVLRKEQRDHVEAKLGPQSYGPGYALALVFPIRKLPDKTYHSGEYPANLDM